MKEGESSVIVSFYRYKAQRALRRISREVHVDLYHQLLEADRQTLTLTLEQEARLIPEMHFLHEENLMHFWVLPEEETLMAPRTKEYVVMKPPTLNQFQKEKQSYIGF